MADLTQAQMQILATELALPAYAQMSDQAAADALNERNIPHPLGRVSIPALKNLTMITPIAIKAGGSANLWYIIKTKAAQGIVPMAILWDLFVDPDFQTVDFAEGGIQKSMLIAGLDNLVADDPLVFDETHKAAILAQVLALAPNISRAEQLELPEIAYFNVGYVRDLAAKGEL